MSDLKVTLIQSDIHWENIDANLAMFEEKIASVKGQTDLIILPEMFSTGFSMNPQKLAEPVNSKTFRWMKMCSAQSEAAILGSYIVQEQGGYYNRCYIVRPDGSFQKYDKRHLFGLAGEDKDYIGGKDRLIFTINNWKIFPQICYDLRFPVFNRSQKSGEHLYEYDLIIFIASWPKPRIHAWDTLLQARGIENLSYSVGVNRIGTDGSGADYIGHSGVYDYLGQPVVQLGEIETIESATLSKSNLEKFRDKFPFQKDADNFRIN